MPGGPTMKIMGLGELWREVKGLESLDLCIARADPWWLRTLERWNAGTLGSWPAGATGLCGRAVRIPVSQIPRFPAPHPQPTSTAGSSRAAGTMESWEPGRLGTRRLPGREDIGTRAPVARIPLPISGGRSLNRRNYRFSSGVMSRDIAQVDTGSHNSPILNTSARAKNVRP
jgi:hypothetical protein